MAHLNPTVPWELLSRHIDDVGNVIRAAVALTFCIQQGLGLMCVLTDVQAAPKIRSPLWHGGFGPRNTTMAEADAALLPGAAMAHSNLAEGPAA